MVIRQPTPIDFTQKYLKREDVECYYQYDLFTEAINASTVDNGLFLEFGLYVGNTANQICDIAKDKILYGFDSFQGLEDDVTPENLKGMLRYVGELPKYNENVRIVLGKIQESLPIFLKKYEQFVSYVNFDVTASGVEYGLSTLADYGRLKKGTSITILHAIKELDNKVYDSIYQAFMRFADKYKVEFRYVGFGDVHLALVLTKDV